MYPLALRRLHPYFTFTGAFTGALTASAPRDVESARHTAGSMLLAMNPPEPSHNVAFTPPTCLLRAEMEVSNGEPDGWVGTGNTPASR